VTTRGNCRTAQVLDARNLDAQEDLLLCAAGHVPHLEDPGGYCRYLSSFSKRGLAVK